ncbi:MAG: Phosphonoacetaldehyde hydrolase [Bacteroidota bacterium]|jgi:phosphonatase-like hydrolase
MLTSMVVFDMAGTTVDENNVVYKTLHAAIVDAGVAVTLDDVLLHGAGKEKLQAIKDVLVAAQAVHVDAKAIYEQFVVLLASAYSHLDVTPCSNAETVFALLKKQEIKVVLNTGYNRATATDLLRKLNWTIGEDIDLLVTASDVSNNRPAPDMIDYAIRHFNIENPASVVKVGDSAIDIEEGKNAGCGKTFGVTTGAQTKEQIAVANPTAVLDDLLELMDKI